MFKQKIIYRIIQFLFRTSYIIIYNIYSLKKRIYTVNIQKYINNQELAYNNEIYITRKLINICNTTIKCSIKKYKIKRIGLF